MQLISSRTCTASRSPEQQPIGYSSAALRHDLERVRGIWNNCQATRDRNAIYGYLTGMYGLVV
jgi:hypothetical protein